MLQLREVIQAFRECGVPNDQVERFGFVDAENDIQALVFDLVQAARHRFQFRTFVMPGWDPNICRKYRPCSQRCRTCCDWVRLAAFLVDPENEAPQENYGHAVTLVGCRCPFGKLRT